MQREGNDTRGGGVGFTSTLPLAATDREEELNTIPYKECIKHAEDVIARIAACDDVDEHVQLVREAERYIREAQARIERAEGDIQRILGSGIVTSQAIG